jgi:lysophospholipase L1-like esterase
MLGFGTLEAGVRVLHLVPDRFWEKDPELGWRHVAGKTGWWTQEEREFVVPIRINRLGLRDVEREYAKPANVTRVLLLGDSFIEAMQVPLEGVLATQMQERLGPRVEVINAGVSGYGTASELLFLQREGFRYDPDVVLLAFYPGNDVKNNSPALEDGLRPAYGAGGSLQRVVAANESGLARERRRWSDRLRAVQYGRQVLLRHPELAGVLHRLGVLKRSAPRRAPERDGIPVDYLVFAPERDAEWETAWQYTEQLLTAMRDAVSAKAKRFAVLIIPTRYQIYPEWWEEAVSGHPAMQGKTWDVAAPAARVQRWCDAHGVPCLDLAPAFTAARSGPERLFFHYDGHWTPAGHALAARQVAEFLRQHEFVAAH